MRYIFLLFLLLFTLGCSNQPALGGQGADFAPESLCIDSGGLWEKVSAHQFGVNPDAGIFDPDNHPDYNYRCVCGEDYQWSINGCV